MSLCWEQDMAADIYAIDGMGAAFFAGMVTSLHCVGMCGPLAIALAPRAGSDPSEVYVATTAYHVARIIAYTLIGALAGLLGMVPLGFMEGGGFRFLPWIVVAFFLIIALGLDKHLPKPKWMRNLYFSISSRVLKWPKVYTGAALGLATPFLPCGPLYLLFGLALFTGSALRGAEFLMAFGLGTLPLLFIAQTQFLSLQKRAGPVWIGRIQRFAALMVAFWVAWRLRGTIGLGDGAGFGICH